MYKYLILLAALLMAACEQASDDKAAPALADILAAQPDDVRARYPFRHPQETLEFFEIEPGMTVVEGLPGRGWYTKVLAAYLGSDGHIIGIDYAMDMWPLFSFGTEEFLQRKSTWTTDFPVDADEWRDENSATIGAHVFGSVPTDVAGTADVVFFARVLHNLANFQNAGEGQFLNIALVDAYTILKPGGVFGVVQHHARDDMSDDFANGTHGYLKKDFVIAQAEAAGFEFVDEIDVNANAKDRPSEEDIVWRLPPTYALAGDDPDLRAEVDAIGESNRMTLKFRKLQ
jgi:predicted methyltransferase